MKRKREMITLGESTKYEGDILQHMQNMLIQQNNNPLSLILFVDFLITNIKLLKNYKPLIRVTIDKIVNYRDYYHTCYNDFETEITNYKDIPYFYDTWLQVLTNSI